MTHIDPQNQDLSEGPLSKEGAFGTSRGIPNLSVGRGNRMSSGFGYQSLHRDGDQNVSLLCCGLE